MCLGFDLSSGRECALRKRHGGHRTTPRAHLRAPFLAVYRRPEARPLSSQRAGW